MRWMRWLFVVLVLVAAPAVVSAQDDIINGTVTGPDGKPVAGHIAAGAGGNLRGLRPPSGRRPPFLEAPLTGRSPNPSSP